MENRETDGWYFDCQITAIAREASVRDVCFLCVLDGCRPMHCGRHNTWFIDSWISTNLPHHLALNLVRFDGERNSLPSIFLQCPLPSRQNWVPVVAMPLLCTVICCCCCCLLLMASMNDDSKPVRAIPYACEKDDRRSFGGNTTQSYWPTDVFDLFDPGSTWNQARRLLVLFGYIL